MKEISIKLQGGLGNYMFQIACAYSYSLKNEKTFVLSLSDSITVHKNIESYRSNILSNLKFTQKQDFSKYKLYNEPNFFYESIPDFNENVFLVGYFQSEKYFKNYRNEILNIFSFPTNIIESVKNKYKPLLENKICSIHVRRGDFLKFPDNHPTQNMNYYMKAIKQMPKDSVFFIFSDDIEWCKQNFPDIPEKFHYIENQNDYEDLLLMSMCTNNITCNSSFSWWGAWLNQNPSKVVIAPTKWFGPAYAHFDTKDIYCDNWIKI